MPIVVECEHCGARERVRDSLAGKRKPCRECGERIEVPFTSVGERPAKRRPRPPQRRSAKSPQVAAAVVAIVIGIAVTGGALLKNRSRPQHRDLKTPSEVETAAPDTVPGLDKVEISRAEVVYLSRKKPQRLLVKSTVLDFESLKNVCSLGDAIRGLKSVAFSDDGRHLYGLSDRQDRIEILSTDTGQRVRTADGNPVVPTARQWTGAKHLGDRILVTSQRGAAIYPLKEDGSAPIELTLPSESEVVAAAAASDGRHAALGVTIRGNPSILVFDAATGALQVTIRDLSPVPEFRFAAHLKSLAFSEDGKEVAGLFGWGQGFRLVAWDLDGTETFSTHRPESRLDGTYNTMRTLSALPDGSGWLIDRWLLDRKSGMIVWEIDNPSQRPESVLIVDERRLLTYSFKQNGNVSPKLLRIPRAEIDASLKSMGDGEPALLKAGDAVSVRMAFGRLSALGSAQEVERKIVTSLRRRLEAEGFVVQDGAPIELTVNWEESQGGSYQTKSLKETDREFVFKVKVNERQPIDGCILCVLSMRTRDEGRLVWRDVLEEKPYVADGQYVRANAPPLDLRRAYLTALDRVSERCKWLTIPAYVPQREGLERLPILTIP